MQFSGLGSSKMEVSETDFFHILTIPNDQISYVKHVLAPPYVFLTLFGCWGGVPSGLGHNLLMKFSCLSHLSPLQGALPKAIEFFSGSSANQKFSLAPFGASQFRPTNFFGAFGASNNSEFPEGGSPPQPPPTP